MFCDFFVFAGERSGDLHGEKLLKALLEKNPDLTICGVAGPKMRSTGMDCVLPMEEFQVMGFIDVFLSLPKLYRQFFFVAETILKLNPGAVITIDYPGFNLRLARHLRKHGYKGKLIHFICPSVWAWGKKRIPLMAQNLDLLLCILPFEKEIFAKTPLNAVYVGHPLLERLKTYSYKKMALPQDKKVIALFPGSRKKEIMRNLPLQLEAVIKLMENHDDLHVVLCVSDEKFRPLIATILKQKGSRENWISLVSADYTYELMKQAHLAIAKSGTVTLELALHGTPTVVTYAVSRLDKIIAYDILRIRLPFYCLVNIIAQKQVFPELIGPHCTSKNIVEKAKELLEGPTRIKIKNDCLGVVEQLGRKETSKEAADQILKFCSSD